MGSPSSCIDCMDEGNLPVPKVERERRDPDAPRVLTRFEGICGICDMPMTGGGHWIVLTTRGRWVHEGCIS